MLLLAAAGCCCHWRLCGCVSPHHCHRTKHSLGRVHARSLRSARYNQSIRISAGDHSCAGLARVRMDLAAPRAFGLSAGPQLGSPCERGPPCLHCLLTPAGSKARRARPNSVAVRRARLREREPREPLAALVPRSPKKPFSTHPSIQ